MLIGTYLPLCHDDSIGVLLFHPNLSLGPLIGQLVVARGFGRRYFMTHCSLFMSYHLSVLLARWHV